MMLFRAFVKNEGTAELPWFVYVETEPAGAGSINFSSRFKHRRSAEETARYMNMAWKKERSLLTDPDD